MQTIFFGIRAATKMPQGRGGMVASNQGTVSRPAPRANGGNIGPDPGCRSWWRRGQQDLPTLVMWHAKDSREQWQQIVQEQQDRNFSYLTEYRYSRQQGSSSSSRTTCARSTSWPATRTRMASMPATTRLAASPPAELR